MPGCFLNRYVLISQKFVSFAKAFILEIFENREAKDVGVILNTGAGKTLVGLLIGQSMVNEIKVTEILNRLVVNNGTLIANDFYGVIYENYYEN